MKLKLFFLSMLAATMFACEGMYDSLETYYGEKVYPAKYDTIVAYIGYERVEIDLLQAGRIPTDKINMGKAKQTLIEYDDEKITIPNLVSWVNVTGLTQPKIYRIKVSTVDEYGNRSVPQEIAVIPFTESDMASLEVVSPRVMTSPTSAVVEWPNGFGDVLLSYRGLSYRYTDKDGNAVEGSRGDNPRFFVANLATGKEYTLNMKYRVIPKVNGAQILDTLVLDRTLTVNVPTASTAFSPVERDILVKNGVTAFTFENTARITKLTYPVHANSLQDVFYFPNLKELDLTGGTLFDVPELKYDGREGAKITVGGGPYHPFMRKVSDIASNETVALRDLLEAGSLEKIVYAQNSMGLDEVLAPYAASGIVEVIPAPAESRIPREYFLDGLVQDGNWKTEWEYPASNPPEPTGLNNIFKVKAVGRSSTFVLALPREYRYNVASYKYLRMKVYAPAKSEFEGDYGVWQRFWFRFMNNMWAFGGNSDFGQEYWEHGRDDFKINDASLQKWTDFKIDISNSRDRHTRVIVVNIGGEPSWGEITKDLTFYFADVRLSKE